MHCIKFCYHSFQFSQTCFDVSPAILRVIPKILPPTESMFYIHCSIPLNHLVNSATPMKSAVFFTIKCVVPLHWRGMQQWIQTIYPAGIKNFGTPPEDDG
jgi:hypothetical protein